MVNFAVGGTLGRHTEQPRNEPVPGGSSVNKAQQSLESSPSQRHHHGEKRTYAEFIDDGLAAEPGHDLPDSKIVGKAVNFFCQSFHHWIPFLHKARLQEICVGRYIPHPLSTVLHAILAVSLRHIASSDVGLTDAGLQQQATASRAIAQDAALNDVSLESAQILMIMVFDHVSRLDVEHDVLISSQFNHGTPAKAWPLVGALTRIVDCLQLNVEPGTRKAHSIMPPIQLLDPELDWTAAEERRRLFWVVFLYDRYKDPYLPSFQDLTV